MKISGDGMKGNQLIRVHMENDYRKWLKWSVCVLLCMQKDEENERIERRRTRSSELINESGGQSVRETRSRTLLTETLPQDTSSKAVSSSSENLCCC